MDIVQRLHSAGLRKTRARKIVLQVLCESERPLSHQELAGREQTRMLDRVTLYRTLTTLEKAGLLHRVQGIDGIWRYRGHPSHSKRCAGNHIHFLCLECNQMACLPEQSLPWVEKPPGAEVFGKQLVVYGRCPRCTSAAPRRERRSPRGSGQGP